MQNFDWKSWILLHCRLTLGNCFNTVSASYVHQRDFLEDMYLFLIKDGGGLVSERRALLTTTEYFDQFSVFYE